MKFLISAIGIAAVGISAWIFFNQQTITPIVTVRRQNPTATTTPTPSPTRTPPPAEYVIPQTKYVGQTFNNCGPASLSMLMSYENVEVTQQLLGEKLRPYQNPQGDNDDKSVTVEELAVEAKNYNLLSYHRPHGSLTLIKQLVSNDIPVLVRTWLHPNEDIGHYRIVRGYSDTTQEIIHDDSYEGGNLRQPYTVFLETWQPFNYEYLVLVTPDKKTLVENILQSDTDNNTAWQNAYSHALEEATTDATNPYPVFNQSVALFHLGRFKEAKTAYESVASALPNRMLWYQIEPIEAYLETGNYDTVFTLTDRILNNHNRGFSELYILRGKAYEKQGDKEAARAEYEKAVFYNNNLVQAQQALQQLQ